MVNASESVSTFSWYQVPADLKALMAGAVECWYDPVQSESFIETALAHPACTVEVLISAYRYFFYRHNDPMAKQMALRVLERVRRAEQLPTEWNQLQPLLYCRRQEDPIRLYLTTYVALGFIFARLGEVEEAKTIATRVQSIDDHNEFGASLILSILSPSGDDDDD